VTEVSTETAIIGGGQAGVPLARALSAAGRDVVLIERAHLGGSCVNFGCTPSKAIIASARAAADARRAGALGIRIPRVEVDFLAVMDRARALVAQSKGELDAGFKDKPNVQLLTAHGRLEGRDGGRFTIRAGDTLVRAERVVLDTGSRTARPPIPGLDQVPVIDAENWIDLRELPRHVLMLGGGYIALEMSQAFQRLGSAVTVLQKGAQLADREDPDVAEALQAALERDGVRVQLNTDSGKARELGKTEGFIKVVADAKTGVILGAAAVCEQGAEVVQLFVELMNAGGTVETVRGAIHIHPTLAEAAKNAALAACK